MKDTRAISERIHIDSEFVSGCAEIAAKHIATEAVKQARDDALRWVLEQLDYKTPEYFSGGISSDVMNRVVSEVLESERSRLRAIIEKELSK